jgi:hypothetical protein
MLVAAATVELASINALGVLLIVSRRQLTGARRALDRSPVTHRIADLTAGAGTFASAD